MIDLQKLWISFFFLLGEWSVIVLFFVGLFLLWNQKNYMSFFVIGFILNFILNMFLKAIIKQPRPSTSDDLKRLLEKYGLPFAYQYKLTSDLFGFPSGHAQVTFFTLTYLYLVDKQNIQWPLILLTLLILLNRYIFQFHDFTQLFVGILCGIFVAWIFYKLSRRGLTGRLREKKDDNFYG